MQRKEIHMPRHRVRPESPLTSTERVQRSREGRQGQRRVEVLLDLTTADQISRFAQQWDCSKQEVLKIALRACLPAMKIASTGQDLFNRVRDALETVGIE
jgi:hypothetical protein